MAASGRPVLGVEGVCPRVFEELLDTVCGSHPEQPLRPSPIATPQAARAAFAVDGVDITDLPAPAPAFHWRWLTLRWALTGGVQHVSLAVAVLRNAIDAQTSMYFINMSLLDKYVPTHFEADLVAKRAPNLSKQLSDQHNQSMRLTKQDLGLGPCDIVPSRASARAAANRDPLEGGPLAGQFRAHMATPKGLLAYIASRLRFARQASAVQAALHELLLAVCSHMGDGRLTLDDGLRVDMAGGRISSAAVSGVATRLGMLRLWCKGMVNIPDLAAETVPVASVLWFAFRHMGGGAGRPAWCHCLASSVARRLGAAFGNCLTELPDHVGRSPASLRNAALAAGRGDDRSLLYSNAFLRRNVGVGAARPIELVGEVARDARAFIHFRAVAADALVTTYFVLGRAAHVDRLRGDLRQEGLVCVGDKFSGDNSRVSCKDVMATSIHSGGLLMAGPVQVMPDRAAALKRGAVESARGVVLPLVGGANLLVGAKSRGRRELQTRPPKQGGEAAREFVVGMCNALFAVLPLKSLQAYAPTHTDAPTASTTRQRWAQFGGMRFNADSCSGDAHWVLPPELWPADIGCLREQASSQPGVVVRILVIASDEGSPILKTFFPGGPL